MGAKFFVISLNKIIKYAVVALAIIGVVIVAVSLTTGSKATYKAGTYTADIVLNSRPVKVEVTVDRQNIKTIELIDMGESQAVFYPVFQQSFDDIADNIISLQSTEGVSLTEDNRVTGGIILDAVNMALNEAKVK